MATGLEANERNLLRLNCHWLKNRLDYDGLRQKYITREGGKEVWKDSL